MSDSPQTPAPDEQGSLGRAPADQPVWPQSGPDAGPLPAPASHSPAYPPAPGPPVSLPYSALVGRQLTSDETLWGTLAHLGGIIVGFVAPLVVLLVKGDESPYTRYQSVEALNFQITVAIGYVAASVLSLVLIGIFLFPVLLLANLIFCVMAGMAANKGETYKYPFAVRLVK